MRKVFSGLVPLAAVIVAVWLITLDRQGQLLGTIGMRSSEASFIGAASSRASSSGSGQTLSNPHRDQLSVAGRGDEGGADLSRRLGVDFVNLPMPGDGLGEERQFREVLKILDDPDRRPALVHCAGGTCRTGASVAFYRFERDGWTPEDVASELERQTYHYGLVPGYIYAMVKTKPLLSLLKAESVFDRNRGPGRADRRGESAVGCSSGR